MDNQSDNILRSAQEITGVINSIPYLHFIVREADLENAIRQKPSIIVEQVLKKAVLYANKTILLATPTRFDRTGAQRDYPVNEWNVSNYWGNGRVFRQIQRISNHITDEGLFDRIFTLLPETIETVSEPFEGEGYAYCEAFNFSESHNNPYGIELSLADPTINYHIFEKLNTKPEHLATLNVWLPELKNIPLEVIMRLREDEADSFQQFQYALRKMITNSQGIGSDDMLKELFQYVDYEVRTFRAKMDALKKGRTLSAYEAIVGSAIAGLCFAIPNDVAKMITSFIGAYQSKDFLSNLIQVKEKSYDMKTSDFYVPWLCTAIQN